MLKDVLCLFKTSEEWFLLRKHSFSFKKIGEKGITKCSYNSLRAFMYQQDNHCIQLFIHIPELKKTFFLSSYEYPQLQSFVQLLQSLKVKTSST